MKHPNWCESCSNKDYQNGAGGPCATCRMSEVGEMTSPLGALPSGYTFPVTRQRVNIEMPRPWHGVPSPDARSRQVGGDHYKEMGVEPWDVIDTWPREQRIGAYRAGTLKYLMRMGRKDEAEQEIAKGQHYLEKLLEVLRSPAEGHD